MFIADGHHRYETALNYQREVRAASSAGEEAQAADYILITLTAFEDEGLLVLPTHRLIRNVPPGKISALPSVLAEHFTLSPSASETIEAEIAAQSASGKTAFGVILPHAAHLAVLTAGIPESSAAERLPASLLGTLILDQCLGIDAAQVAGGSHVSYTRDLAEAAQAVASGDAQAAFVLGRPSVAEVEAVSLAGEVMPQKSTFFYPKLLSGLVLRDLRDPLALDQSQEAY